MDSEENPACNELVHVRERRSKGETCPAWCDGDHPAFRKHVSSGNMCYIDLALGGPDVGTSDDDRPDDSKLEMYLEQDVREVGPRVVIGQLPTGWPKLNFLPLDALHLSEALARLAYTAIDDRRSTICEPCSRYTP